MTRDRFEVLVERLLDGELDSAGGDDLAAIVRGDPARRRELRQQLMLWEIWSQHLASERSAAAFLQAVRTRRRAEREGERFVSDVHRRLANPTGVSRSGVVEWIIDLVRRRGDRQLTFGLAAVSVFAVGLGIWLLTAPAGAYATVTIHGEAVCTACMLHETHEHLPAIRVREGDRIIIYYVSSDPTVIHRLGDYCRAPVPVTATGSTATEHGRFTMNVGRAERDSRASPDQRTLFPF